MYDSELSSVFLCVREGRRREDQPRQREHFKSLLGMQIKSFQLCETPLVASGDLVIGAKLISSPEWASSLPGVSISV